MNNNIIESTAKKRQAALMIFEFMPIVLNQCKAKECALIAVGNLISSHNKYDDYAQTNTEDYYYWQGVKEEIEKL